MKKSARESNGHTTDEQAMNDAFMEAGITPETILSFLIALSTYDGSPRGAEIAFRDALRDLLPGVDHVSVAVNVRCPLYSTLPPATEEFRSVLGREIGLAVLESIRQNGFPVKEYGDPVVRIYDNGAGDYLGALILWRRRGTGTIPEVTLEFLETIASFIRGKFVDLIVWHDCFGEGE